MAHQRSETRKNSTTHDMLNPSQRHPNNPENEKQNQLAMVAYSLLTHKNSPQYKLITPTNILTGGKKQRWGGRGEIGTL